MQKLNEGISFETTVNSITARIGTPITQLYHTLTSMSSQYFEKHHKIRNFGMVSGSTGSRWFQTFYENKLQSDLYDLVKYSPKNAVYLHEFLSTYPSSFKEVSDSLPEILIELSDKIKTPSIKRNAIRWAQERNLYKTHIENLKEEESKLNQDLEQERSSEKSINDRITGQQNSQVEEIISSVLKRLPVKVAGEIRHAIARKDDKLQALQRELSNRKINLHETVLFDIVKAMDEITTSIRLSENILNHSVNVKHMDSRLLELEAAMIDMDEMMSESKFRKTETNAVPNMRKHDGLDNSSPYAPWRFGIAMAGSPEFNMDKTGPTGQKLVTIAYTDADAEIIKATEKFMGSKGSDVTTKGSKETDGTNVKSSLPTFKKSKAGI